MSIFLLSKVVSVGQLGWRLGGNVIDTLRMACREEDGQNIAEYALILALILVLAGASIRFIAYAITGQ